MGSSEPNDTMILAAIYAAQRQRRIIKAALFHRGGYKEIDIRPADTIQTVRAKLAQAIFHIR